MSQGDGSDILLMPPVWPGRACWGFTCLSAKVQKGWADVTLDSGGEAQLVAMDSSA